LPSPAPALLTGYRPRAPANDLKEIVEDAMEEILRVWDDRFRDTYRYPLGALRRSPGYSQHWRCAPGCGWRAATLGARPQGSREGWNGSPWGGRPQRMLDDARNIRRVVEHVWGANLPAMLVDR
jgi:hypothetical protein